MFGLKGADYIIVALVAGTAVSDPDKIPENMRTVQKALDQFNQLSDQAKEALRRSVQSLESESGHPADAAAPAVAKDHSGSLSLIDLAHKLGLRTEGKTEEEIANDIARMAVAAAKS